MKKKILISLIWLTIVFLNGCFWGETEMIDNDRKIANNQMNALLETLKNKDKAALKIMFAENAISKAESFEKSMNELFDYFQGDFLSYDDWNGPGVEASKDEDIIIKEMYATYDVKTDRNEYRFAIRDVTIDTSDPQNVGIWSLYIIKMEDDTDPQVAYRGDKKYTPGINIGIKNSLPEDW